MCKSRTTKTVSSGHLFTMITAPGPSCTGPETVQSDLDKTTTCL